MTASPIEHVIQNLIHLLSAKIDSASRCALYEGEARAEGHEDCPQVFSELAVKEREGINAVLACLSDHLDHHQKAVG